MSVFSDILARTPYLVIPRLALEAMPEDWQIRMRALLDEANEAGLSTPAYFVFRDKSLTDGYDRDILGVINVSDDPCKPFYKFHGRQSYSDPWADYRHGSAKKLCKVKE